MELQLKTVLLSFTTPMRTLDLEFEAIPVLNDHLGFHVHVRKLLPLQVQLNRANDAQIHNSTHQDQVIPWTHFTVQYPADELTRYHQQQCRKLRCQSNYEGRLRHRKQCHLALPCISLMNLCH